MQRDVYVGFIVYTKVLDKIRRKIGLKMQGKLDLFSQDIRIIQNLHWEKTACTRIGNQFSKYKKKETTVNLGSVFLPNLINLQSEAILR